MRDARMRQVSGIIVSQPCAYPSRADLRVTRDLGLAWRRRAASARDTGTRREEEPRSQPGLRYLRSPPCQAALSDDMSKWLQHADADGPGKEAAHGAGGTSFLIPIKIHPSLNFCR